MLLGLQHLYADEETRTRLFALLEETRTRLFALLEEHMLRQFLGHADIWDKRKYEYQTVVDNVCLVRPELLAEVGQLIVESGHAVARKKPGEPLRGRCDSFAVEADVHYLTDVNLLMDAMRCLVRATGRSASEHGVAGWRQWRYLTGSVKILFNQVRSTRPVRNRSRRTLSAAVILWSARGRPSRQGHRCAPPLADWRSPLLRKLNLRRSAS